MTPHFRLLIFVLLCTVTAKAENATLQILRASYGAGTVQKDVTAIIQAHVRANMIKMRVGNDQLGGDPIFGKVKTLSIRYRIGGQELETTAQEGQFLTIPNEQSPIRKTEVSPPPVSAAVPATSTTYPRKDVDRDNTLALSLEPPPIPVGRKLDVLKTKRGTEFRDVEILSADGGVLKISHKDGITLLPFSEIPGSTPVTDNKGGLNASIIGTKIPSLTITLKSDGNSSTITYNNALVVGLEPDALIIESDGLSRICYKDLPENLQKECNFDQAAADAYSVKTKLQQAAIAETSERNLQQAQSGENKTEEPNTSVPIANEQNTPLSYAHRAGTAGNSEHTYQNPLDRGAYDKGSTIRPKGAPQGNPLEGSAYNASRKMSERQMERTPLPSNTDPITARPFSNDNHSAVVTGYGPTSEAAEQSASDQAHALANGKNGHVPEIKKIIRSHKDGLYQCTFVMSY